MDELPPEEHKIVLRPLGNQLSGPLTTRATWALRRTGDARRPAFPGDAAFVAVPDGRYRLRFEGDGFLSEENFVEVVDDGSVFLRIEVAPDE
jgi:hypothetical protein